MDPVEKLQECKDQGHLDEDLKPSLSRLNQMRIDRKDEIKEMIEIILDPNASAEDKLKVEESQQKFKLENSKIQKEMKDCHKLLKKA